MATDLLTPILDGGIRNTHFFNGRLLTAQDLQEMQEANRLQHRQLGQAIGAGVVWGLEVSLVDDGSGGDPPVVSVTAGLAVNRFGHALTLPAKTNVMLAEADEAAPQDAGLFQMCTPPKGGTVPAGEGVCVLTVRLASGYREWVPKRGFGENGRVDSCGWRYTVEGVQFHLEELSLDSITGLDQDTRDDLADLMEEIDELRFKDDATSQSQRRAKLSKLRNWLAHVCLGTEEVAGFCRDPFERVSGQSPYLAYGAADGLRAEEQLSGCDVPLALIYWTEQVHFVDMWSVRRRPTPQLYSTAWPLSVNGRRLAEGEAAFLQFQEQVACLARAGVPTAQQREVNAVTHFRYLPSVGVVPIAALGAVNGFSRIKFFENLAVRDPVFIEGARVLWLLRQSFSYPPIDLASGTMMWLYLVRENIEAIDNNPTASIQTNLIFSSGYLPYLGDAQYDLAHWQYGNYELSVVPSDT
jgi:hypothetical protein